MSEPPLGLRVLFALALATMLGLSARETSSYARLAGALQGASLLERGRLGNDEQRNFLPRATRVQTRKAMARGMALPATGYPRVWPSVVDLARTLPVGARVYLNLPDAAYYFFATTLWFPRPVAVSRRSVVITSQASISAAFEAIPSEGWREVAREGFTHVVIPKAGRIQAVRLPAPKGETQ